MYLSLYLSVENLFKIKFGFFKDLRSKKLKFSVVACRFVSVFNANRFFNKLWLVLVFKKCLLSTAVK